ncbi:hypothetical protein PFISCL1PPCAC_7758, partial [Pristionchus fissidentatus]
FYYRIKMDGVLNFMFKPLDDNLSIEVTKGYLGLATVCWVTYKFYEDIEIWDEWDELLREPPSTRSKILSAVSWSAHLFLLGWVVTRSLQ